MNNDPIFDTLFRKTAFADDLDAFKKIFIEFYPSLCVFAGRYLSSPETCEDIVQEVFMNIWKNRKTLNIHSSFRNFLITSVRNSCTDYLRKLSSHDKYLDNYSLSSYSPAPDEIYTIKELEEKLKAALEKLPLNIQIAFNMSRTLNMTYKEIATEMKISPKTVESYISQALKMLREELKDYLPITLLFTYFI
ncbi:MAG: RNA polymerase sigma-70 factor [Candidatus Saccharimonadaceae bacterium]